MAAGEHSVVVDQVSHAYGSHSVLRAVSVNLLPARIYGLIGPNGAGKSTFVKILAGLLRPSAGSVRVHGRMLRLGSPADARHAGVVYAAQEPSLIDVWSVEEQLAFEHGVRAASTGSDLTADARRMLEALNVRLNFRDPIETLPAEARQALEIVKGLSGDGARLILVDEPTTGLDAGQRDWLFDELRTRSTNGATILIVSHDLERVHRVSDEVLLCTDGKISPAEKRAPTKAAQAQTPGVGARGGALVVHAETGTELYQARQGEILGLTGSLRTGVQDWLRRTYGIGRRVNVACDGHRWVSSLAHSMRRRIAYLSRERQSEWGYDELPIWFTVRAHELAGGVSLEMVDDHVDQRFAQRVLTEADVRPADPRLIFSTFSGGNRQKAVVAATVTKEPSVLLLDEPLSGVDASARKALAGTLKKCAEAGQFVVVYSQEIDDLERVVDRMQVVGDV